MRLAALALAVCSLPSLAAAGPLSVGFSLGKTQSKAEADQDANGSRGVFARLGLSPRLSAQLEIERVDIPAYCTACFVADTQTVAEKRGTLLAVVDLGHHGHLVPVLMLGYGIDRVSDDYGGEHATHTEVGLGLEYRAQGGLSFGADLRIGGRTLDDEPKISNGPVPLYRPTIEAGEYRSARVYVGVRF